MGRRSGLTMGAILLAGCCLLQPHVSGAQESQSRGSEQNQNVKQEDNSMKGSHIHLGVRDLPGAVEWFERVWQTKPTYRTERMAILPFGPLALILDAADQDSPATIGFESQNCDQDYRAVIHRGAVSLEEPQDRPWGVRAAAVRGPGALKLEIEQPLKR